MLLTRIGVPKLWGEDPDVLWAVMRYTVAPVMYGLTRAGAYGIERVPPTGGAVIAANHLNAIDHPLVGLVCPRPVYFISKAELMKIPVAGEFLGWAGAFPVRRESPTGKPPLGTRLVADGKLLGMHVEGTRQRTGHPGAARRGAAMIAIQEGVPILPLGLETFGWSFGRPKRCAAVWGPPILLDDLPRGREGTTEATERIRIEIARLWQLAGEAISSGCPEVLSDGTRRSPLPRPSLGEVRRARARGRAKAGTT